MKLSKKSEVSVGFSMQDEKTLLTSNTESNSTFCVRWFTAQITFSQQEGIIKRCDFLHITGFFCSVPAYLQMPFCL